MKKISKQIITILIFAMVFNIIPESVSRAKTRTVKAVANQEQPIESPMPTQSVTPFVTSMPTAVASPTPVVTPEMTPIPTREPIYSPEPVITPPVAGYCLLNEGVKKKKNAQAGIKYHRVKNKYIYQIKSYTTDKVALIMSQASRFKIVAAKNKKQYKKPWVKISRNGVVSCKRRGKNDTTCVVIEATSVVTGKKQYIYIYFGKKLYCKQGKKIKVENLSKLRISFNYSRKRLQIIPENKEKLTISKNGNIKTWKKGRTSLFVKVKGSQNNYTKICIIIKSIPWIVSSTNNKYGYSNMVNDMHRLRHKYGSKVSVYSIGKTADNREIMCMRIGSHKARKKLVIDGAIHAREWKNVQILMRQAEDILQNYPKYYKRLRQTCVYFLPNLNPDGVSLCQNGLKGIRSKKLKKKLKKMNKKSKNFSKWKSNARGVNLNNNFPAGFKSKGKKPGASSYPGKKAGSEKETKAIMRFMNTVSPNAVINVHSMGNIIYWDYDVDGNLHSEDYELASKINSFTKYKMMPKCSSTRANGGLADWLNYKKGICSVTVETGSTACPLPHSQFKSIYKRTNKMFRWFVIKY